MHRPTGAIPERFGFFPRSDWHAGSQRKFDCDDGCREDHAR